MLLCARCGASNAETAPLCGNCGASLKEQYDTPSSVANGPGQPFARNAGDLAALSIDELPTAHMPGVSKPADIVPLTPPPFSQAFPVEIAPDELPLSQAGVDVTVTPSSQPAFTPQPGGLAGSVDATPLDIADYPTSTSVPVPPVPVQDSSDSSEPLGRLGKLSLPSRPKPGSPASQPGINTPPSQPSINSSPGRANPPSQPNLGQQVGPSGPPSQAGLHPQMQQGASQMGGLVGRSGPPSQAGLHPQMQQGMPQMSAPPGLSGPPSQAGAILQPGSGGPQGAARPLSQPGFSPQPALAGGNWQEPRVEAQYQAPSQAPTPFGSANPGGSERREPVSQGGLTPPAVQTAPEINKLVRPLPLWARLGGPIVGALLLLGLIFVNPGWATGAMVASIVAITLAVLLAIATGVRGALGMFKATNPRRRAQVISVALLVLLLLLFSGAGISQQRNLHLVQARYLESQGNWPAAIAEYQAGGERSDASLDVARAYNEWGEDQNRQQQYEGAVTSFGVVITNYQQVPAEFARAKSGIVIAYLGWGDQASQKQDYAGATAHYNALLSWIFCNANSCMQQAQARDATAYYHLAEQRLAQQQYAQAVDAYRTLQNRFPKAPEVSQMHAHYAQALWGQGQQQLNSSCSNALSTYRLLAQFFADTSEGQQATSALQKPVAVKGHFTQSVPGAPYRPTAYLVQGLMAGMQQYQFPPLLAHAPAATIHSDGSFSFTSVPQGTYELVWSSDSALHYYYAYNGKHVLYAAHVGPLCTFDYGDIDQAIPTK